MADILRVFKRLEKEGELAAIDVALAKFLKDADAAIADEVLILVVLVSYKYRSGDVCLDLDNFSLDQLLAGFSKLSLPPTKDLLTILRESSVVGSPGEFKPLILEDDQRLYFHKLWMYEQDLADMILERSEAKANEINSSILKEQLDQLFPVDGPDDSIDWQKVAAVSSVLNKLTVISGGPGTGKTTTVVRILALLALLAQEKGQELSVALAAPTGKAASRLKNAIAEIKNSLPVADEVKEKIPDEAVTIHQLLGARRYSSQYKHDEENPLPYDVVIVDEASMIDQVLMSKLMKALLAETRFILLGDKDQLASVEAGSVLRNICNNDDNRISKQRADLLASLSLNLPSETIESYPSKLTDNIILLQRNYRFKVEGGIAKLSESVRKGNSKEAISTLHDTSFGSVTMLDVGDQSEMESHLKSLIERYSDQIKKCTTAEDYFKVYRKVGILAAHRRGPRGVEFLNSVIEQGFKKERGIPPYQQWYTGRPVIINKNDYNLGLYNGDIGICRKKETGEWRIHFEKEGEVLKVPPSRLSTYDLAFALTIHKSQGSEFDEVVLLLPDEESRLLSRELLYTGITRARKEVIIYANEGILNKAIQKITDRSTGLKHKIWK